MSNSLSQYFWGIGIKRLSDVEVATEKSNQHEFNGSKKFKEILGTEKIEFTGKFLYLAQDGESIIEADGKLTWYDTRWKNKSRSPEHRLYYKSNNVINAAKPGDLLVVARTGENELLVLVAKAGSTAEQQLLWLLGFNDIRSELIVKDLSRESVQLGFAAKQIISSLGFQTREDFDADELKHLLKKFGNSFPKTTAFSEFARHTTGKVVCPVESPDDALLVWLEREELLFRTLERFFVKVKLKEGFGEDGLNVDDFISFSLSVQNRRKSRAGLSFENHLAYIFTSNNLKFTKKGKTERYNEPDFLFPGINEYRNPDFDAALLTMLGLKTTAKDRWRQVIPEAERIWPKHLITLEPAISKNQTDEMVAQNIQLVLPSQIKHTYLKSQQSQILTLSDFIQIVLEKQSS